MGEKNDKIIKPNNPSVRQQTSPLLIAALIIAFILIGIATIKGLQNPDASKAIEIAKNYHYSGRSLEYLLENPGGLQTNCVSWEAEKVSVYIYSVVAQAGNEIYYFEVSIPERTVRPLSENAKQLMRR